MKSIRRFSLFLWLLLRHLPSITLGRLLMPSIFISSWTVLNAVGLSETNAFVWAGVLAQAAHVWAVLPVSIWRQNHAFGRSQNTMSSAILIVFGLMVLQIWWADPWMSQRLVSIYCAIYAAMMAFGVWGDRDIMNRTVPVSKDSDVSFSFRSHLLKLRALVAILVIATNESLLALDAPLAGRVATLSLLPLVLHYFFVISLRLTCSRLDER